MAWGFTASGGIWKGDGKDGGGKGGGGKGGGGGGGKWGGGGGGKKGPFFTGGAYAGGGGGAYQTDPEDDAGGGGKWGGGGGAYGGGGKSGGAYAAGLAYGKAAYQEEYGPPAKGGWDKGGGWGGGGKWGGGGGGKWGGGGGGKGGGDSYGPPQHQQPAGDGMLWEVIQQTTEAMSHLETQWDATKLEKKLRDYFSKGAKNMSFNGKLPDVINEYADNALGSIFAGLGDRDWLYSGQVDFLACLDAGIKDTFPGWLLNRVSQQDFEQLVLAAYERAFDEQRFCPILSEAVPAVVSGPKIRKKVWNAVDQGRKDTVAAGIEVAEDFTQSWIENSIGLLQEACQGGMEGFISAADLTILFTTLLEAAALPAVLGANEQPPVHICEDAVKAAYGEGGEGDEAQPMAKKMKVGGGSQGHSWGPPDYGGKGALFFAQGPKQGKGEGGMHPVASGAIPAGPIEEMD